MDLQHQLAQAVQLRCEQAFLSLDKHDFQQDLGGTVRDWWWYVFTEQGDLFVAKITRYIRRAKLAETGCLLTHRQRQQCKLLGRKEYVYRMIAYGLAGALPSPRDKVRHLCGNPRCIHPEHLRIGTTRQNGWDERFARAETFGAMIDKPTDPKVTKVKRAPFRVAPSTQRRRIPVPKNKPQ